MNSSRESLPSIFLSICLKILSVLFSGVDSSSGIFITDPTLWGEGLHKSVSFIVADLGQKKMKKEEGKVCIFLTKTLHHHHQQTTNCKLYHIQSTLIYSLKYSPAPYFAQWRNEKFTQLICVAISRGEAALWPSADAFSTTKQKSKSFFNQIFLWRQNAILGANMIYFWSFFSLLMLIDVGKNAPHKRGYKTNVPLAVTIE